MDDKQAKRVDELRAALTASRKREGGGRRRPGEGHRYRVNQEPGPMQGHAELVDDGPNQ